MHCGDQRHLGLCLGYVPALAYGSCRVSDQGTTLRASDLHNARATILNPFIILTATHGGIDWFTEVEWRIYASVNYPSLVQIMACRLVGVKPLSEPILEYHANVRTCWINMQRYYIYGILQYKVLCIKMLFQRTIFGRKSIGKSLGNVQKHKWRGEINGKCLSTIHNYHTN